MTLPPCNPEVYRLAAKLLVSRNLVYTCMAITHATEDLRLSYAENTLYRYQYEAMFGPCPEAEVLASISGTYYWLRSPTLHNESDDERYERLCALEDAHPFWNKAPNRKRQKQRILALLFMAAICENPQ